MSKGQGKIIGIEFTEELIGSPLASVSKVYNHFRWAIPSVWSGNNWVKVNEIELYGLVNGVETLVSTGNGGGQQYLQSNYYSSYSSPKAFDLNTVTYWYSRTPVTDFFKSFWIQVYLPILVTPTKFRWYITTTYPPKTFVLYASTDYINWDVLVSGSLPNATGWYEFAIVENPDFFNAKALSISWLEPEWIEKQTGVLGPSLNKSYVPKRLFASPDLDKKKLLIEMDSLRRFCNALNGNIVVTYTASSGDLQGVGGVVESFTESFTALDLIEELEERWYKTENISAGLAAYQIALLRVYYGYGYFQENVSVGLTNYGIVVTKVGSNPL